MAQAAVGYKYGRLVEQSGGMVDSVVHPVLLKDSEARLLRNVSISEKGTVKTSTGRMTRFATAFDANNPCNGIYAFYPDTTTARLVMGAGTALYQDTPHLLQKWDSEPEWSNWTGEGIDKTGGTLKIGTAATATTHTDKTDWDAQTLSNVDTASSSGDVKLSKAGTEYTNTATATADFNGTHSSTEAVTDSVVLDSNLLLNDDITDTIDTNIWSASGNATADGTYLKIGDTVEDYDTVRSVDSWAIPADSSTITLEFKGKLPDTTLGYVGVNLALTTNDDSGFGFRNIFTDTTHTKAMYATSYAALDADYADGTDRTYKIVVSKNDAKYYVDGTLKHTATHSLTGNIRVVARSYDANIYAYLDWVKVYTSAITYASSGVYTHGVLDVHSSDNCGDAKITFNKTTPTNTSLTVEVRTSSDGGANWSSWAAKASGDTIITEGTALTNYRVQWRANLSTSDTSATPSLNDVSVTITYDYVASGTVTSVELDGLTYGGATITVTKTEPTGTSITAEYRESDDGNTWTSYSPITSGNRYGSKRYFQYRVTLAATDVTATPTLSQISIAPSPYAISPTVDISAATTSTSGAISEVVTLNGTSSATVKTRTSANGSTWDAWTEIDSEGKIQSSYRSYIQVLIVLTGDNSTNNPTFNSLTLSYDGTPAATELLSGFTAGGQFFFAALLNTLVANNMLDAPKKWDGTTAMVDLGGTPPHGQYVATHKNYLFMARTLANPNRLYWSEVLNIESWPALNFIDISPNDGDWITGLLAFDDYLIITKNRSIWLLLGSGSSDFEVRRIHDGVGCVAPRSLTKVAQQFGFASTEGYYLSDLSQETLLTERLKDTWQALNQRRLNQITAIYYDHKLRIDVPNGSSTVNDMRIMYDAIQKALDTEVFTDHASCYTKLTEAGHEILLYGHANEGQVSRADYGTTDDGAAITMTWGTKHFNFGSSAIEKKLRYLTMVVIPASSETTLSVYLVVDGVKNVTALTEVIPGDANGVVRTIKLDPRTLNVRKVKSIGYEIVQSTINGGVKIHELLQEYMVGKIKETA